MGGRVARAASLEKENDKSRPFLGHSSPSFFACFFLEKGNDKLRPFLGHTHAHVFFLSVSCLSRQIQANPLSNLMKICCLSLWNRIIQSHFLKKLWKVASGLATSFCVSKYLSKLAKHLLSIVKGNDLIPLSKILWKVASRPGPETSLRRLLCFKVSI